MCDIIEVKTKVRQKNSLTKNIQNLVMQLIINNSKPTTNAVFTITVSSNVFKNLINMPQITLSTSHIVANAQAESKCD